MGGGGFPFGAPIPPRSGSSPASLAGPCRPGLPPFVAVLVPVFSLSSPGALVCFVLCFLFFFFFCVSTARRPSLPLVRRSVLCPPPPCPLATSSLSSPLSWVGGGEGGWGGGRPRCPSSGVSTSQARRRHEARHLSLCRGGGGGLPCGSRRRPSYPAFAPTVPPPLGPARRVLPSGTVVWSVPHPLSAASPPCRFVLGGGGGRCPPLPSFIPHPWGGGGVWGGGGLSSSLRCTHVAGTTQARRRHEAPHLSLCRGGEHALWLPSSPFLPCVRTPGGPPAGACTARALYGHGRVVRPAPSRRCLPTLPLCPRGGAAFRPPLPAFPTLGGAGVCGGGRGAHVVFPPQHACRRHDASTTQARGEALGCCGGGGVSPLGLPALLHGLGSALQDLQPLLPLGGSCHVSAWCSVSRACSLLCPYLLEEVRTRVETDDEEVRAAGRTYCTPRRLLAPSAALVEGRAPVSAPNSPGGADCPSSPWCLCVHFRAA